MKSCQSLLSFLVPAAIVAQSTPSAPVPSSAAVPGLASVSGSASFSGSAPVSSPASVSASAATACDADYIVETCLTMERNRQAACNAQDYSCLCAAFEAIDSCYNNCPNDPRRPTAKGQVSQYCALASQYATTNSPLSTVVPLSSARASATPTSESSSSPSSARATRATAASSSPTSGAASGADLAMSAGGLLAALAGIMGALL